MSDTLHRSARGSVNQLPCVFAAALNARAAVCGLAVHADNELRCSQPVARAHCAQIDGHLRQVLRFALGNRQDPLAVSDKAATLAVQSRGLQALHRLLALETHAVDVQRLLESLELTPGGVTQLPHEQLLQLVMHKSAKL